MFLEPYPDPTGAPPDAAPAPGSSAAGTKQAVMSELAPYFLNYAEHELGLRPETLYKYKNDLQTIVRIIGDLAPQKIRVEDAMRIKEHCLALSLSAARISMLLAILKSFLKFCRMSVGLETIEPKAIRCPRIPKREVLYLTADEVRQFVSAIPIKKSPRKFHIKWLCFRVLVEVLLGTGMRLSEALSLQRSLVDLETGEAKIVGKGNKERTVFFSPRALNWVKEYLKRRQDGLDALFLASWGMPLSRSTAVLWFREYRKLTGFKKKVTAHTLRHTVATTLLFNGCPIGHIKQILGHADLMTTCKYYLGSDRRACKEAYLKALDYDAPREPSPKAENP